VSRAIRLAVVGGGIAGLAAAWEAVGLGCTVTLFEQAASIGGKLALTELATPAGPVVVDGGAEAFLARRPEVTTLAAEVGLGADLVSPATTAARVWSRGAAHALPSGTVLGIPTSTDGLAGLLTPAEVARVAAERSLPSLTTVLAGSGSGSGSGPGGGGAGIDVAVGELVAARLGDAVVDRLVEPLLGGVYAGQARSLSLAAVSPALHAALAGAPTLLDAAAAVAARGSGALAATGPVFGGIRGGVGRLPGAVADAVGARGGLVRTSTTVRGLRRVGSAWQLRTGPVPAEELVEVDAVVLAVPGAPAARLLLDAGVDPGALSALAHLVYASVGIALLAVSSPGLAEVVADTSGLLVPPVEGRTLKAATWSSTKWSWVADAARSTVLLRASVGRAGDTGDLQRPDDQVLDMVTADLEALLDTPFREQVVSRRLARWGGALPQYRPGHPAAVTALRGQLGTSVPAVAVCGAATDGVGIPACIAGGRAATRAVLAALG
jgi:oxygen-dependent protoporphyrinogen oxidase